MLMKTKLDELEKAAIGEADFKAFGLKPCPFPGCGSHRLYVGRSKQNAYIVQCLDCGGRSVEGESLEEAVEHWGRQCSANAEVKRKAA